MIAYNILTCFLLIGMQSLADDYCPPDFLLLIITENSVDVVYYFTNYIFKYRLSDALPWDIILSQLYPLHSLYITKNSKCNCVYI